MRIKKTFALILQTIYDPHLSANNPMFESNMFVVGPKYVDLVIGH